MRDVEELELRSWHCPMCGCTNKMVVTFNYRNQKHQARKMRCCNCGQETWFTNPNTVIDKRFLEPAGRYCLQRRACFNYNCPLHPKYKNHNKNNEVECAKTCCSKNQIFPKLTINLENDKYL